MELIAITNDSLKEKVLNIYLNNKSYFNKISNNLPTISTVEEDMSIKPANLKENQKKYSLISLNNEIIGVLDYLINYPEKESIYIGFFMIDGQKHRLGIGSKIFRNLEILFKNKGFSKIRIGVLIDNEIAFSFWKKQDFKEIERKILEFEKGIKEVIVMEKYI